MKLEDLQKAAALNSTLFSVRADLNRVRSFPPHKTDAHVRVISCGRCVEVHLTFEEARLAIMMAISALENQERELVARLKDLGVEA